MPKAETTNTTPAQVAAMLAPFFPRWRGDASEPALAPAPVKPRLPAARARQLVAA